MLHHKLEMTLDRLDNVKREGNSATARCPAHDDKINSLNVNIGDDGRVLLKCFAGCTVQEVVGAIGLKMADLFEENKQERRRGDDNSPSNGATPQHLQGCTLAKYAEAKALPVEFLEGLGIREITYTGAKAVKIPYFDLGGEEKAVRFRVAVKKAVGVDQRFRWMKGSKPLPYGLWRLQAAKEAGYIVIVEGESDAQTLWLHEVPAIGLPGADTWKEEWASYLEGIPKIYVVVEPDKGGETVRERLSKSVLYERIYFVELGPIKDASGLYLSDQKHFLDNWRNALTTSICCVDQLKAKEQVIQSQSWEMCSELARTENILGRFVSVMDQHGVTGEARAIKLLYLVVTSRLLDRPVSVAVKGPSSGGKSFLVENVLKSFPPEAFYALSAMSERALAYSEEPLSQRMLVIYEAAGMQSEFASYLLRSLLSEGKIRYETVQKTSDGLQSQLIERKGPTGLIVTTTATSLHPENETRLLSLSVNDTPEQTKRILSAQANAAINLADLAHEVEYSKWQALQTWLQGAEHQVIIPYANILADFLPPINVRLRRDFPTILSLIKAHAILHQESRKRDADGRIIANLYDYSAVRELVVDLVSQGVQATVSQTTQETVSAVAQVCGTDRKRTASLGEVAQALGLDKGSASRRVKDAEQNGWIRNLEPRQGRPSRLIVGAALPDEQSILPTLEALTDCCSVAPLQ